jgi:hypothetical protein
MNMLQRHCGGEDGMWAVVHCPDEKAEDERRLHRELERLRKEKIEHNNRLISLVRLHGPIKVKINGKFGAVLEELRTWSGAPLPKHARAEMEREFERWKLVTAQIKEVTDLMKCSIKDGKGQAAEQARRLGSLRGIGLIGSYVLTHEMFSWREFHNRKEVGAYVGLTGTREIRLFKDGCPMEKKLAYEERLAKFPELKEHLDELLEIAEGGGDGLEHINAVEARLQDVSRDLARNTMSEWAVRKESETAEVAKTKGYRNKGKKNSK